MTQPGPIDGFVPPDGFAPHFRFVPGEFTFPTNPPEAYNAYQEALWKADMDFIYAHVYGFAGTRLPDPTAQFNATKFEHWKVRFLGMWERESNRLPGTRAPVIAEIPGPAWLYLYERLRAAKVLKKEYPLSPYM